ncbi:uncharacterized protein LOC143856467 [Tasmannia lanceolata]|uniref:uncharacterized protein LOC143856467 n=1 Tax=Tasmannia lanceolata TaxID=3420 RepID=UPI0040648F37
MASDDTMSIHSSIHEDDDYLDDDGHPHHSYTVSRLSMCSMNTNHSSYDGDGDGDGDGDDDDDDEDEHDMMIPMSCLSVDDEKERKEEFSGSRKMGWFSLPTTPSRRIGSGFGGAHLEMKEYGSENEGKGCDGWRRLKERRLEKAWEIRKYKALDDESESNKSLCMDMEEVKGCMDLGFELQHLWTVEIPSRMGSTIETDSGGNSPIANWRISSPGDDPRDVKARLKVWAQAVALASTSRFNG